MQEGCIAQASRAHQLTGSVDIECGHVTDHTDCFLHRVLLKLGFAVFRVRLMSRLLVFCYSCSGHASEELVHCGRCLFWLCARVFVLLNRCWCLKLRFRARGNLVHVDELNLSPVGKIGLLMLLPVNRGLVLERRYLRSI